LQAALAAQLAGEGKELFAFMGARCDAMTASVLGALHLLPPSGGADTRGEA